LLCNEKRKTETTFLESSACLFCIIAFLLFLAGLEVELERLKGRLLLFVSIGFLLSLGLALLVGFALFLSGQVLSPLFIAIVLVATALGVIVPLLKDAGESDSSFGQLVIAGAMFAEFGSIIVLRVPIFLLALLLVRGVPTLLYRPLVGGRRSVVAGLLQATSLSFIVAATQIGLELHLITKATGAALVAAGLLSVLIFPIVALTLLRQSRDTMALAPEPVRESK